MRNLVLAAALGLSLASVAYAAPTDPAKPKAAEAEPMPPAPAKPTTAAKPMAASATAKAPAKGGGVKAADRTPISKACSAQADTKKLHGKEREKFRAQCMKG
jgi:hypothetical protein